MQGHFYASEEEAMKELIDEIRRQTIRYKTTNNKINTITYEGASYIRIESTDEMADSIFDLSYSFGFGVSELQRMCIKNIEKIMKDNSIEFHSSLINTPIRSISKGSFTGIIRNSKLRNPKKYGWAKLVPKVINSTNKKERKKIARVFDDKELVLDNVDKESLNWDLINAKIEFNKIKKREEDLEEELRSMQIVSGSMYNKVEMIQKYIDETESKYLKLKLEINKDKTW